MTLRILSTNERLDAILKFLSDGYTSYHTSNAISVNGARFTKIEIYSKLSFAFITDIEDIDLILDFLCDDEHSITRFIDERKEVRYSIGYLGRVFIEKGGYVKAAQISQNKEESLLRLQNEGLANAARLNTLTFWLTIGTVVAATAGFGLFAIEIYKIWTAE